MPCLSMYNENINIHRYSRYGGISMDFDKGLIGGSTTLMICTATK